MASTVLDFEKPIVELESKITEMKELADTLDIQPQIEELETQVEQLRNEIYSDLTRWQRVQIARHPDRPYTLDYITECFDDFVELHGDRTFRDDPAIVGGTASINGKSIMVIGHQKGRDTKSNLHRNFGMPNPEGYRKAHRLCSSWLRSSAFPLYACSIHLAHTLDWKPRSAVKQKPLPATFY